MTKFVRQELLNILKRAGAILDFHPMTWEVKIVDEDENDENIEPQPRKFETFRTLLKKMRAVSALGGSISEEEKHLDLLIKRASIKRVVLRQESYTEFAALLNKLKGQTEEGVELSPKEMRTLKGTKKLLDKIAKKTEDGADAEFLIRDFKDLLKPSPKVKLADAVVSSVVDEISSVAVAKPSKPSRRKMKAAPPISAKEDWEIEYDKREAARQAGAGAGTGAGSVSVSSEPAMPIIKFYQEGGVDHLIISASNFGKRSSGVGKTAVKNSYIEYKRLLKGEKGSVKRDSFEKLLGADAHHLLNSLVMMLSATEKPHTGLSHRYFSAAQVPGGGDQMADPYLFVPSIYLLARNHLEIYYGIIKGEGINSLSPRIIAQMITSFSFLIYDELLYDGGCASDEKSYIDVLEGLLDYDFKRLSIECLDIIAKEVVNDFNIYVAEIIANENLARVIGSLVHKLNEVVVIDSKFKVRLESLDGKIKIGLIAKRVRSRKGAEMAASGGAVPCSNGVRPKEYSKYFFISRVPPAYQFDEFVKLMNSDRPSDFTLETLEIHLYDGTDEWKQKAPNSMVVVDNEKVINVGLAEEFFRSLETVQQCAKGSIAVPIMYGLISVNPDEFYKLMSECPQGINYLMPRVYAALLASCLSDYALDVYLGENVDQKPKLVRFLQEFHKYDFKCLENKLIIMIFASMIPALTRSNVLIINDKVVGPLFLSLVSKLREQCSEKDSLFYLEMGELGFFGRRYLETRKAPYLCGAGAGAGCGSSTQERDAEYSQYFFIVGHKIDKDYQALLNLINSEGPDHFNFKALLECIVN